MNIDFSELSVMQLSDSFFPSGLYTMSNGLETVFDEKKITTADGIKEFLHTIIREKPYSRLLLLKLISYNVFCGGLDW